MKRVVLVLLLLLVICGVAGLWLLGLPYVVESLRQRLEREISVATGSASRIDVLDLSLVPPGLQVRGAAIGTAPPLAEIERLEIRVFPLESLAEGRLVLAAKVESLRLDSMQFPRREQTGPGPEAQIRLPPMRFHAIELTEAQLRFPLPGGAAALRLARAAGELTIAPADIAGTLEITAVELERGAQRLAVEKIAVDGGADAQGLFINRATLMGEGITVSATGADRSGSQQVSMLLDVRHLAVIADELAILGGTAQFNGTLRGNLADPGVAGRLAIRKATVGDRLLGDLESTVTRDGASLRLHPLQLVGRAGAVTGAVRLTLAGDVPLRADLQAHEVQLEELFASMGQPIGFHNQIGASASVQGTLDPLDLRVAATGTVHALDAVEPRQQGATFELGGRVRPDAVEARLELAQPEQNRLSMVVGVKGSTLNGHLDVDAARLAALTAIAPASVRGLGLTGQMQSTFTLSGTTTEPRVAGGVSANDVTVMGAAVARVSGEFMVAGRRLTVSTLRVDTGSGHADLSGILALGDEVPNDWRLTVHDLRTDLVVGVLQQLTGARTLLRGGRLDGSVTCRGSWTRAETQIELAARSLFLGQEPLERLEVTASSALPRWRLGLIAVHAPDERLTIDGNGDASGHVQLAIDSTPLDLAKFRGAGRQDVTGTAVIQGKVSGDPRALDGFLRASVSGLGVGGEQFGDLTVRGDGRSGVWTVTGTGLRDSLRLDATLRTESGWPYTLAAQWQDSRLIRSVLGEEPLEFVSSGEVNLAGSLELLGSPSGTVRVTGFELRREPHSVTASEPIHLDVEDGHFRIRSLALMARRGGVATPGGHLRVTGDITTSGHARLEVDGRADLVFLEFIGRPFSAARGEAQITAQVVRTPETGWDLRGRATIEGALVDLGGPLALTKTNATLTFLGSKIQIDEFAGQAGGGDFRIVGNIDLDAGPDLDWSMRGVALSLEEGLEVQVSGRGQTQGSWQLVTVSGDVEVLNALYDEDIEVRDLLPSFKKRIAAVPRTAPRPVAVEFDLRVYASGGAFIDNNLAKAETWLDLQLSGPADQPAVTGTVGFLSGEVTFRKRTFTITAGSIDFVDRFRLNPVLNFDAESEISTGEADYTVTVAVSGTAEEPRVQFIADDPNLSQNDVLSLVTFGKTMAQLQGEGGGVSALDALALVPTGEFGRMVGFDTFEIEATRERDTGTIRPQLTIGKVLTDRLRAQVSTSFGVDARQAVQLEYRMTRRISLLGSWEGETKSEAGAFGGGVKFRYDFRKLPFSLLGGDSDSGAHDDAE